MLAVRWRSNRRNSLLCQTPTSDYRERDIQLGVVSAKVYVITKLVVLYANTCVYFVRIIHKACTHGTSLHPCSLIHLMAVVKYHRHFCCFLYLLVNWLGCLVNCFKQVSFTTGTHLSIPTWIANSYEFGYTTIFKILILIEGTNVPPPVHIRHGRPLEYHTSPDVWHHSRASFSQRAGRRCHIVSLYFCALLSRCFRPTKHILAHCVIYWIVIHCHFIGYYPAVVAVVFWKRLLPSVSDF